MHPKISVIIPIYNVEKYLRRCLDSIKNQTFKDWQAICVDDGTPDNSGKIAEEYAAIDKRFVVVHKENGGLSDARNAGMKYVDGEYVMYVDSDDFIHPQTMEIAYFLIQKNKTDIVSWYKNTLYRPQLSLCKKLGFDIDAVKPVGINKHFNIDKIKYFVTNNIFEHATEISKSKIKWPIKHCYVWRHLFKTDLIRDVDFIKGILFEDFPWWSAVMLKKPTVTITKLPLYYYYPNLNSIDKGSGLTRKIRNWLIGLKWSFELYKKSATDYEMKKWCEHFMWPVIIYQIARKLKYVTEPQDIKEMKMYLIDLSNKGVFDNPTDKQSKKYQTLIYNFIKE
ncbi:MAG: glycosyltransferase family 2 protein [Alphaproteobacteria bacterium]|nr:glycosyltransferase family 2 protein [Alphaproteobacteria bacterium]